MPKLKGLATGIGSLPYKDANTALDLIFKYAPNIPFWPQLPKRDFREGMVIQFSENLPFLKLSPDGLVYSALQAKERELEIFYEHIIANDTDYFKISPDFALGLHEFAARLEKTNLKDIEFIKGQVTGPFTFAASINDEKGSAVLYDAVFMQVVLKGLIMKAAWQMKLFSKFGKKMIMFIDEPYLGCFGSAYTPLNREDALRALGDFSAGIKEFGEVSLGVHCCGNTDWSIFTDIATIDIINFDAFDFMDRFILYADNLKTFLKRGGIICWGIVPTSGFSGKETPESLAGKLREGINALAKKGVDKDLLLERLLVSPACGLGSLDPEKSEDIFKLLSETSKILQK